MSSHTFMLVRLRKADNERGGKRKKRERTIRGKQKQKSHHPYPNTGKNPDTSNFHPAIKMSEKKIRETRSCPHSAFAVPALGPKPGLALFKPDCLGING